MPIYTYKCTVCGLNHEINRSIRDTINEYEQCPNCSGTMKRLWSLIPSIWKTDGAYSKKNHKKSD